MISSPLTTPTSNPPRRVTKKDVMADDGSHARGGRRVLRRVRAPPRRDGAGRAAEAPAEKNATRRKRRQRRRKRVMISYDIRITILLAYTYTDKGTIVSPVTFFTSRRLS